MKPVRASEAVMLLSLGTASRASWVVSLLPVTIGESDDIHSRV